ncbi:glutathione S-transferase theta-1-like [Atheta coriaria]|uniref:glutathione S-transferase theta-1-like n=1 Tax=Dalotia coriaria TaxID=877792 RepID=UPI0031F396E8
MSLKLYYDLLSQPSRSLYILLKLSKTPFEQCVVPLRQGVHMMEDYKTNVSKFGKVPVLHDGNYKLAESVAIVRYLSNTNRLSEKYYPKDAKAQAAVDEYLEWQHHNVRAHCALYFRLRFLTPLTTGQEPPAEKVKKYEENMNNCLDQFEEYFLTPGPFICGPKPTVADVFAATEIEQPRLVGYDPTTDRPVLSAWLKRVREEFNPAYAEAHTFLEKVAAKKAAAKL